MSYDPPGTRAVTVSLPALTTNLGVATTAVNVTWSKPMLSAVYAVLASVATTAANVGDVVAQLVAGSRTTTGCQIEIRTTVTLAAGTEMTVTAAPLQ